MSPESGKYMIVVGAVIILLGLIIYFFHDKLHWIGHLPGDIRVEKENFRLYFPITTMVLFSVLVSVVLMLIRKIM